ncbi:MAG: T9SS type A sorting domain-containing protein [Bacteroidetes bacterium]|nr:T9SS type A sorting domain-containing protein [Bacteroidota bacterium]
MKSRFLLLRFFVFVLGIVSFCSSSISYAGNPDPGNSATDRMLQIRANQTTGGIDARDVLKAQIQLERLTKGKSAPETALDWQQVGPNNASGRTRTILYSNKDASGATLLTGGVTGGIWKSRNGGLTWHQMNTQDNEVLRVTSIVQTSGGTTYVATGESFCNRDHYVGTGIYRSDDDSVYTLIPNTRPALNDTNADWAYISRLAVSPSGRIYAATNTGLKYSDNGNDWSVAKSGHAYTVTVGPDGTVLTNIDQIAWIAVGGEIANFVNLSTGTSTTFPSTGVGGIEFAISPSNGNIMYASLVKPSGMLLNVYKSSDKGTTWSVVFPGNTTFDPYQGSGCYSNALAVYPNDPNQVLLGGAYIWHGERVDSNGFYNWEQVCFGGIVEESYIMENITPPGRLLVPIFQHQFAFRPNMANQFATATDDGISVGTISGTGFTYQHMIRNLIISQFSSVAPNIRKDAAFGGCVYVGSELVPGGTYLNEPQTGKQLFYGYGGDVQWSLISPTSVFVGSGATTTAPYLRSEDLGVTVSPTFVGTLLNTNYTPACYWEDFNFTQSVDSVVFKNIEKKILKDQIYNVPSANARFPMPYIAPYDIDSLASITVQDVVATRFFISGTVSFKPGIYMTKQALQFAVNPLWFRIENILPTDAISCYAVSKDLSVLWAGTTTGKLFRMTNIVNANDSTTACVDSAGCVIGHSVYDNTVYPQFANRYITSISLSPDNQTVLVTLGNYGNSNYVYRATDGLSATPTFASVQSSLPAMPVYSSILEMSNPNLAIIGTEFGAFSADDITVASPAWTPQNTGTGNVPVTMIKQQSNPCIYYYRPDNFGDLYLATYGRGMFQDESFKLILGTDPLPVQSVAANQLKVQPNPFTGNVSISYKIEKGAAVNAMVYDLSGRIVFTTSFGNQQPGEYIRSLNLESFPSGTYIIKLDYGTGSSYGKAMKVK